MVNRLILFQSGRFLMEQPLLKIYQKHATHPWWSILITMISTQTTLRAVASHDWSTTLVMIAMEDEKQSYDVANDIKLLINEQW